MTAASGAVEHPADRPSGLPIDAIADDLVAAIEARRRAVVVAPPGSGKTTRLPLVLDRLLGHRTNAPIVGMLVQPRRVAARAVARRLAKVFGEPVGRTVGIAVRDDARSSAHTRILVVTPGVYLQQLRADPELPDLAWVMLDEFHERRLDTDLALALTLDSAEVLREDLAIVVTSATLDAASVASLIDGPAIEADGRLHPVTIDWTPTPPPGALHGAVADGVERGLKAGQGDVLTFLPGVRDIDEVHRLLDGRRLDGRRLGGDGPRVVLHRLHGRLPSAQQDAALAPARPGTRHVVLSTSIAETSLTVPGVDVVVDAGFSRVTRADGRTGIPRLGTVRVSRAEADQRAGRAGRVRAGTCVRLWDAARHAALEAAPRPEILRGELTELVLALASVGIVEPGQARLLDTPDQQAWDEAVRLLRDLGAVHADGRITDVGRHLAELGSHPRIGALLLHAARCGAADLGAALAVVLEEGGMAGVDGADLLEHVRRARRERRLQGRIARRRDAATAAAELVTTDEPSLGRLVAIGFPDRVAQARGRRGTFRLAAGGGARVPPGDALAGEAFLATAELGGDRAESWIRLAAAVERDDLLDLLATSGADEARTVCSIDDEGRLRARRQVRWGRLVLKDGPAQDVPQDAVVDAWMEALRRHPDWLPRRHLATWIGRVAAVRRGLGEPWPAVGPELLEDDVALLEVVAPALRAALPGVRSRGDLDRVDLVPALTGLLPPRSAHRLDTLAPTRFTLPSGRVVPVDYTGGAPTIAGRVQEFFGTTSTPSIVEGRVPLRIELLAPSGRPVQITEDLATFWERGYPQVRAELRGRYVKHPWPEDPVTAEPTARAKRRR